MAESSAIEWTDATWNPITGCTLVSEGCRHCYAARLAGTRMKNHPTRQGLARQNRAGEFKFTGEVRFNEGWLDQPLRWKRPRRIFVCAHGDLFHESVPDEWIDRVFAVMALAPQHTFQVLTKRPERARRYFSAVSAGDGGALAAQSRIQLAVGSEHGAEQLEGWRWPLPNVWLGTSVEDQAAADKRIPELLATPAAVRFISAEPLLGPIDLLRFGMAVHHHPGNDVSDPAVQALVRAVRKKFAAERGKGTLDWVIVGGESGPQARPMDPEWVRSLRDQCGPAGVPFFFKQWGAWAPAENATGPSAPIERGAWANGDGSWRFRDVSRRESEGMRADEAPDLWRLGKKAAGRLLDGVTHSAMPERPE